jgi:hypothetical protein
VPADCISLGPYIAKSGRLGGGSAAIICSPCLPTASVQEPSPTLELDGLQRVFAILGSEVRWLDQKKKFNLYGRLGLKRRLTFQFVCQGINWDSIQVEQRWEEGPQHIVVEQRVYEKFGLRQDDEKLDKAREEGCDMSGERSLPTGLSNELVCGDKLPNAEVAFCD